MMTENDYQHFVCIVAGNNHEELLKQYDKNLKKEPYIKYRYKDAEYLHKKYIELYESLLDDVNETIHDKEIVKETINTLKELTIDEFYEELTAGLTIDENNGDAYSTENMDGKFSSYQIGKLFSIPFLLKDGREVYKAKKDEIYWEKMHLSGGDIYAKAWEMVMEGVAPSNDYETMVYENMKDKESYFKKFETKENYIISNTAFWGYAFLSDRTGWIDASETESQFVWMRNFYDLFIKNLPDDTTLTIYECRK